MRPAYRARPSQHHRFHDESYAYHAAARLIMAGRPPHVGGGPTLSAPSCPPSGQGQPSAAHPQPRRHDSASAGSVGGRDRPRYLVDGPVQVPVEHRPLEHRRWGRVTSTTRHCALRTQLSPRRGCRWLARLTETTSMDASVPPGRRRQKRIDPGASSAVPARHRRVSPGWLPPTTRSEHSTRDFVSCRSARRRIQRSARTELMTSPTMSLTPTSYRNRTTWPLAASSAAAPHRLPPTRPADATSIARVIARYAYIAGARDPRVWPPPTRTCSPHQAALTPSTARSTCAAKGCYPAAASAPCQHAVVAPSGLPVAASNQPASGRAASR